MRYGFLAGAASAALLSFASGVDAQTPERSPDQAIDPSGQHVASEAAEAEELARIVREQAAAIASLEARLAALEGRDAVVPLTASPAPAPERVLASQSPAPPAQAPQPRIDWSKGAPEIADASGRFTFRARGRLLLDASATQGSGFASRNIAGTELRAARLGVEGTIDPSISYVLEVDYTDNVVSVRSANLELRRQIAGLETSLTIGQRLNDRSLDGSSGIVSVPFTERNAVGQALGPQRGSYGLGLTGRLTGDAWHLTAAVTGEDVTNAGDGDDILTWSTRAHWNPVKSDALTVHLGGWAIYEDFAETLLTISRNTYLAGHFNDLVRAPSGSLALPGSAASYGVEAGVFAKGYWIYGEAGRRTVDGGPPNATYRVDQDAWSLAAGWFLTGETPGYQAKTGAWSRTRVLSPVPGGGAGAWEVAARYDDYDFTSSPTGGAATAFTLGVNWYWTSQLRFMFNAIAWNTHQQTGAFSGRDNGQTYVLRSQMVF